MYKTFIRPLLFLLPPEAAHHFTASLLKMLRKMPGISNCPTKMFTYENRALEREVFGLRFKNPVGLAAGFDKKCADGRRTRRLGVWVCRNWHPHPFAAGRQPQPRLFRLPADESLINRMGFNNEGVTAAVERLRTRKSTVLIGGKYWKKQNYTQRTGHQRLRNLL